MTPRPHVTIHTLCSVDGRLDGFSADLGLYYELAASLPHQAVLTGSATMLAAAANEGVELDGEDAARPAVEPVDSEAPWLVLVDSRGQVTRLDWLRTVPYWRDVMVLCSASTPPAHLQRLQRAGVTHHSLGDDHVDLAAALELLTAEYGVRQVRVDAGPTLNGALLRQGLVAAVSVVLAPSLVGDAGDHPLRLVTGLTPDSAVRLHLESVAQLRDDHVWLRYAVPTPD